MLGEPYEHRSEPVAWNGDHKISVVLNQLLETAGDLDVVRQRQPSKGPDTRSGLMMAPEPDCAAGAGSQKGECRSPGACAQYAQGLTFFFVQSA